MQTVQLQLNTDALIYGTILAMVVFIFALLYDRHQKRKTRGEIDAEGYEKLDQWAEEDEGTMRLILFVLATRGKVTRSDYEFIEQDHRITSLEGKAG